MVIQKPPKVLRPKIQNIYIPPDQENNIDEALFDFQQHGKAVYRPNQTWEEGHHTDLTTFNDGGHNEELYKHIKFKSRVIPVIKEQLYLQWTNIGVVLIKKVQNAQYWDTNYPSKQETQNQSASRNFNKDRTNSRL